MHVILTKIVFYFNRRILPTIPTQRRNRRSSRVGHIPTATRTNWTRPPIWFWHRTTSTMWRSWNPAMPTKTTVAWMTWTIWRSVSRDAVWSSARTPKPSPTRTSRWARWTCRRMRLARDTCCSASWWWHWPWSPSACTPAWSYGARTWSEFYWLIALIFRVLTHLPSLFTIIRQRYGMRERLVNHDLEDEAAGVDDVDYQVYAPTTTAATPRA